MGVLCLIFVLSFSTFYSSGFAIILMGQRELVAGCFTLTVFLMFCDSQYSLALPYSAMGWSAVCDCGIFRSYSLVFVYFVRLI